MFERCNLQLPNSKFLVGFIPDDHQGWGVEVDVWPNKRTLLGNPEGLLSRLVTKFPHFISSQLQIWKEQHLPPAKMMQQKSALFDPQEAASVRIRARGSDASSLSQFDASILDDYLDASKSSLETTETTSVWEDEHRYAPRGSVNTGSIPLDPNMTESERFALECLLGENITDMPDHAQTSKGDTRGYTSSEQFALDCLLAPKPRKQRTYGKWLKKCWRRSFRSVSTKRDAALAA